MQRDISPNSFSNQKRNQAVYDYSPNSKQQQINFDEVLKSRSPIRSKLFQEANDRIEQEDLAQEEFERQLDELRQQDGVTEEDIESLRKAALLKKSIDYVKSHANHQAAIRGSPSRYNKVKSKVSRNLKVQKLVSSKNKNKSLPRVVGTKNYQTHEDEISNIQYSKEDGDNSFISNKQNEALSIAQLGMTYNEKNSIWHQRQQEMLVESKSILTIKEQELHKLQSEIESRRTRNSSPGIKNAARNNIISKTQDIQVYQNITSSKEEEKQIPNLKKQASNPVANKNSSPVKSQSKPQRTQVQNESPQKQLSQKVSQLKEQKQLEQPKQTQFTVKSKKAGANAGFNVKAQSPQKQVSNNQSQSNQITNISIKTSIIADADLNAQVSNFQVQYEQKQQEDNQSQNFANLALDQIQKNSSRKQVESVFLNKELGQKTANIQDEFEKLLGEMLSSRQNRDSEGFYQVMSEYYDNPLEEKHESPTKRLISLKNSTFEHKKVMHNNIQKGEYSLTYCSSPGKSYIIEPHGGELNYNIAEKNPLKFYDQVFNQDITQHKVKEESKRTPIQITTRVTKRPYLRIIEKIRIKIEEKLREKIGPEYGSNIATALEDEGIQNSIKQLMAQDKIQILNSNNQPIYTQAIQRAGTLNEDEEGVEELKADEEEEVSPDFRQTSKLAIKEGDLKNIEKEVRDHIRRNSVKPVQV